MNVTVGIILSLAALSLLTHGAVNQTIVECLEKDESKELYIKCPQQSVIRVGHVQFGYQNRPVDDVNSTCVQQTDDACAVGAPYDLKANIMEKCMGLPMCLVVIREKYLYPCSKYSNYFQLQYQCILDKTTQQERMMIDVCGEVLGQSQEAFTRPAGYIESLNYPENYSPDTSCTCHLRAAQPDDTISLEVLDMAIYTPNLPDWSMDWLEYSRSLDEWGEGKRLNTAAPGEHITIKRNSVFLNFKTDANTETRGFWLKYTGLSQNGSLSDVQVNCMVYKPVDYRTDTTCFSEPHLGEMFLNCKSFGVINVLHGQTGYSEDPDCGYVSADRCGQRADSLESVRDSCMGKEDCHVVTHSQLLTGEDCPHTESNYVQVQYQCVKDALDTANIIDICGDIIGDNEVLSRQTGYIESLDYPNPYSPDTKCYCELSVKDVQSEVILLMLDAELNPSGNDNSCGNDWLEMVKGENRWGKGEKICDQPKSEPIHTGSSRVHLNFYSDSEEEGRGFWMKYKGSGPSGESVPVLVVCAMYRGPSTDTTRKPSVKEENVAGDVSPAGTDRATHQGLIVGLSVTAALMLVLVVVMIMFKCKREKSRSSSMPSELDSSHITTPTGYGTLQKFADLVPGRKAPYSTLDESQPNSLRGKPGYQGSSSYPEYTPPDYSPGAEDVVFSQPATSSQYVNPAYDGTLENTQQNTEQHIKL